MATVVRGRVIRGDLAQYDGQTTSASRTDATGGTITGLAIGNEVDVLQVYGAGSSRTRGTIANAVQMIGSRNVSLIFAPGTWAVDASLTIPSNFSAQIPAGCIFEVASGQTLTFAGQMWIESPTTWTSGSGTVVVSVESLHGAAYLRTAAERAASVTPTSYQSPLINILRYGAVGDGTTDDSAAIQRAVDVAVIGGGTVTFPSDKNYKWGMASQVTISSLFPVHLVGNMSSNPNSTANSSYIKPLGNITGSLFKYESPTASVNEGGGGTIRGLAFLDDSNLSDGTLDDRRVYTMDAAINLDSFSLSTIEDCSFHYLRGSAIRTGFCVMSNFNKLWIRYCGASGLPAFDHPLVASRAMQSCRIENLRAEVCFDEPYVYIAANTNCEGNVIKSPGFESDTSIAATSQYYIDIAASQWTIESPHFNRLGATYAVRFSGHGNQLIGPEAAINDGGLCTITGNRNSVNGGHVSAATSTISTVLISGQDNSLNGLLLYFANRIYVTGAHNKLIDVGMYECTSAGSYLIESTGRLRVVGAFLRNSNVERAVSPSGISCAAEATITGCTLIGNTTGPAATGVNVATANQIVTGNFIDGYTNKVVPNGHMYDSIISSNVGFVTEASGTSSITSGNTSVDVTHGLSYTPTIRDSFRIVFSQQATNAYGRFWISNMTATQFRFNVSADPGASGLGFGWSVAPR